MSIKEVQPQLFNRFHQILKTGRLSHAYLFSGQFGSFDLALLLAQSRFCQNIQDALPCGECRPCRLIANEDFTDVKIVRPVNQVIKTDVIRQMLQEFSRSGYESDCQVFIIQDADKMHPNAANSLLKLIEEPLAETYIILLTQDSNRLLPTIKSRCQQVTFPKNTLYLKEQMEKEGLLPEQALYLSQLAESMEESSELAHSSKALDLLSQTQRFLRLLERQSRQAYLEVGRLVVLAGDKKEQDWVFRLLPILSQGMGASHQVKMLPFFFKSRQMWQSHVSFQNALEYLALSCR